MRARLGSITGLFIGLLDFFRRSRKLTCLNKTKKQRQQSICLLKVNLFPHWSAAWMHYSPGGKNTHHTHSQVNVTAWIVSYFRLLQLLMSTWYSCSYFRVLHVDLPPELAIAIHDMKSEGNFRSSHLAASLLLLKGQFTQKKKHFLTMEVKVTIVLYGKVEVSSINS